MRSTSDVSSARFQLHGQDIPTLLRRGAENRPDHLALVWAPKTGETRTWTYRQLHDDTQALASGLEGRGIGCGAKVIVHCENCPEMVLAVLACATIGAVAVLTNTKSTATELAYFAQHTGATAAITQPRFADLIDDAAPDLDWIAVTEDNSGEPASEASTARSAITFGDLSVRGGAPSQRTPDPLLPASIMFTSGTTSRPKAVVHTHGNAVWAARCGPRNIDLQPEDVYLIYLPFFHVNALNWSFFAVLGAGATAILMPRWSASRFWRVAAEYRVTHLSLMPFVIPVLSQSDRPPNSLRAATFGRDLPGLREATGLQVYTAFGMTETVTHAIGAKPLEYSPLRSIGRVLPGYEIAVVDEVDGELCLDGRPGELWIRGTRGIQLFLEYFDNDAANSAAFDDGWFKTGDIVRATEDGVVFYVERNKDLLKVGGENVSAREVEDLIAGVQGVTSVAVVGRSDAFLEQVAVAFVIPDPEQSQAELVELTEQILAACRSRLSDFKVPRAVHFVESFPLGTLDKLLKNRLRETAEDLASALQPQS